MFRRIREHFRQKKEAKKKELEQRLTEVRRQIGSSLAESIEVYKEMESCGRGMGCWDALQDVSRRNEALCLRFMTEEKQIEKELKCF